MSMRFPHFPCVCVVLRLARRPLHFRWAARASCFISVFLTEHGGGCSISYVSAGGCVASSFFTVINTRREPRGLASMNRAAHAFLCPLPHVFECCKLATFLAPSVGLE